MLPSVKRILGRIWKQGTKSKFVACVVLVGSLLATPALACDGRFPEISQLLLEREGAFTNDPDDPGGLTKWGLTEPGLRSHGLSFLDLGFIDYNMACEIYKIFWMVKPGIHNLPSEYREHVFDWEVLHGSDGRTVLQKVLKSMGFYYGPVNGILDSRTVTAAYKSVYEGASHKVNNKMVELRLKKFKRLVERNPKLKKFQRGWENRARRFLNAH